MTDSSDIMFAQAASSIENVVHHLVLTKGDFGAANQTTIYGAVYGANDVSTNRLEVHFRPPPDSIIDGFGFDVAAADQFRPIPGVWRETPPEVDSYGITDDFADYLCTYPVSQTS